MSTTMRNIWIGFIIMYSAFLVGRMISQYQLSKEKNKPVATCEVVDGKENIYRGQCLPEDYEVEVIPLSPRASWLDTKQYLSIAGKVMVEQLIEDAEADGMCLVVTSGYRSNKEQEMLLSQSEHPDLVAKPGESEHQTGLAVDFAGCPMKDGVRNDNVERPELENDFELLPEYKWLVSNANKYGFVNSFTVENISNSGYPVESWHWKLVLR